MWLSGWVTKSLFSACECIKEILFQFHSHLYYFCVLLSNILFYQNLFGSPSFFFFFFFFFFWVITLPMVLIVLLLMMGLSKAHHCQLLGRSLFKRNILNQAANKRIRNFFQSSFSLITISVYPRVFRS